MVATVFKQSSRRRDHVNRKLFVVEVPVHALDPYRIASEAGERRTWTDLRIDQDNDEQRSSQGNGQPNDRDAIEHDRLLDNSPLAAPFHLKRAAGSVTAFTHSPFCLRRVRRVSCNASQLQSTHAIREDGE